MVNKQLMSLGVPIPHPSPSGLFEVSHIKGVPTENPKGVMPLVMRRKQVISSMQAASARITASRRSDSRPGRREQWVKFDLIPTKWSVAKPFI